jgi:phage tail tape-measure protein
MNILKRTLPEKIIRRINRHPVAFISTVSFGWKLGKDGWRYKQGEIDGTELGNRVGSHVGTIGGGLAGAAAGAAAGSAVIPGVGTILGAFAGGMLGENFGGKLGRKAIENARTLLKNDKAESQKRTEPPKAEAHDAGHPKRSL